MSDIEIEIDGKKLNAKANQMVIQVADEAGIYIPRFCYHKQLSIAANCRMCLVEVEKVPKPLPACATPVMPGMKVFTKSQKALEAQKAVMEFLLINHPLDCPICDQGGECELQDLSMGFGSDKSSFCEGKRAVADEDLGPLIATEMTRCIQCTRCVRYGEEIAGFRELGATGRGEEMEIGTYIHHALRSEISGNIIDLCPVGALTSKPYRFTARPWELDQHASIAPHDCLGSNIYVHTRYGKVMRVVPRDNTMINQMWLSDRDRFSYEGLYHDDRLVKPAIRIDNKWHEVDWHKALEFATQELQKILAQSGADQLGALASPNATLEEFYLLQKLLRGLGSSNIDHRLREVDFRDQESLAAFPSLGCSLPELEEKEIIFLIGSNIQKEQPMASIRLRKAALKGAAIFALNMLDYPFHFPVQKKQIVAPHELVSALSAMSSSLIDAAKGKKVCVLLGAQALNHPEASMIRALAQKIVKETNGSLGLLTEGCNSAGAWFAGAIPHRGVAGTKLENIGSDAQAMLRDPRKAYLLLNVEPDVDCANPVLAKKALKQAEFVVALSLFKNPELEQYANVILPISPFTETSGTYVNATGEWQEFNGVAKVWGQGRPAWKVLRVLGNLFHLEGFDYTSCEEIRHEVKSCVNEMVLTQGSSKLDLMQSQFESNQYFSRVGEIPVYTGDSLVRRAKALQATQKIMEGELAAVRMHPDIAKKLEIEEGAVVAVKQKENEIRLPVVFDTRVPEKAVLIVGGIPETAGLSELFGAVEIQK